MQAAGAVVLDHLVHGNWPLFYANPHCRDQSDDAVPGDPREDCAAEARSDHCAIDAEKESYYARFLDEPVLTAVEPEHAVVAATLGVPLGNQRRRIVASGPHIASAAGKRTDEVLGREQLQRLCVVLSDRTGKDHKPAD